MSGACTVVIPCYNEERRLQPERLLRLLDDQHVRILLVDDGSSDRTGEMLELLKAQRPERIAVRHLSQNCGKAEAVRAGLLEATASGDAIVAYYDADLATPPEEMLRVVEELRRGSAQAALAARVALLGRNIRRRAARHYMGRAFASVAALALGLRVYDTQCGAKAFKNTPALRTALARPFRARWAFDVELFSRLLAEGLRPGDFVEVPLLAWSDVAGSKLSVRAMGRALRDVVAIGIVRRLHR